MKMKIIFNFPFPLRGFLKMVNLNNFIETLFQLKARNTTISREVKCGILHFISCSFILAVNPSLLSNAGFSTTQVASSTAISAGVSSILCGILSNLPFILAPTTSTSLYYSIFILNRNLTKDNSQAAVFILGLLYSLCGVRPIALFITNVIPFAIKVGVCLGVGLLIALEAMIEIGLVRTGTTTVLDIGEFTYEIYIAMASFVVIGLALHHRLRGAFLIGLVFGTIMFSLSSLGSLSISPQSFFQWLGGMVIHSGDVAVNLSAFRPHSIFNPKVFRLVFDLYLIGVILLNGLTYGLAETAGLKRPDNSLPRGKWLYAVCGVGTMLSAIIGSGPIMISPESAPGIKSGARTGLSSVVCGVLFLFSTVLSPIFAKVPAAGTSPVLFMIGMMLFENAKHVNWSSMKEALPIFLMATFIPFTYSIFNGVVFGIMMYSIFCIYLEGTSAIQRMRRVFTGFFASVDSESGSTNQPLIQSNCDDYVAISSTEHPIHQEDSDIELQVGFLSNILQRTEMELESTRDEDTQSTSFGDDNTSNLFGSTDIGRSFRSTESTFEPRITTAPPEMSLHLMEDYITSIHFHSGPDDPPYRFETETI